MASSASPAGIADLRAASGGSGRLAAAARVAMLALIGLGWLWIGFAIATNLVEPGLRARLPLARRGGPAPARHRHAVPALRAGPALS